MAQCTTKDKMEFAYLMAKHSDATQSQLQRLMRYGATLNRLATEQCNREWTDADTKKRYSVIMAVRKLCAEFGGVPKFQNDPRGCCLKLAVPDGFTNDWGREGIVVPTS
jgi:hypothetical protein